MLVYTIIMQILIFMFMIGFVGGETRFRIPANRPANAAVLDEAPVAISIEFFAFPAYLTSLPPTHQCLNNLQHLTTVPTPLRIGGTTQDRAVFDPSLNSPVSYSVPSPTTAPSNLTFGPSFMDLAREYEGLVVVGLNRGHGNLTNTILAAEAAAKNIAGVREGSVFLELGNEPDLYLGNGQEIATDTGIWTPETDALSEAEWQIAVGKALDKTNVIQAGNFVSNPPEWGAAELIDNENASAFPFIHDFSHHNYPQSGGLDSTTVNLTLLMGHQSIVQNVEVYVPDIAAANDLGFEYVLGETNSVSGGGAFAISSTFGAALWVLDYTLRASSVNIKRTYFHHGTIGACAYCWWGNLSVESPYYGAYVAAAALAQGTHIIALDDGTTPYSGYLVYQDNTVIRALLYNSDFFDGNGTRTSENFVLDGLNVDVNDGIQIGGARKFVAKRLTAPAATSEQNAGVNPTFGGQWFINETCGIAGVELLEDVDALDNTVEVSLKASEALLLYF